MFWSSEPTPDAKAFVWYANKGIYAGVFVCTFFDGAKEKAVLLSGHLHNLLTCRGGWFWNLLPKKKKKIGTEGS